MAQYFKWFLISVILVIVGYMIAEWQMKLQVEEFLNRKVPNHIDFSYDKLKINLIQGDLRFEKIEVVSLGRQTSSCEIVVHADKLTIDGFNYWKIFTEKSIHLNTLTLTKPHLKFKTCSNAGGENNATKANPIKLLKEILVKELVFESGMVEVWNSNEDVELLSIASIDLNLKEVTTNPKLITEYVPFKFLDYQINIHQLYAPLGKFEVLQMDKLNINESNFQINDIALATVLSKSELSKEIKFQRDHINLKVPEIKVKDHNYTMKNGELQVSFKSLLLNAPKLELYRDKSRLEDLTRKPLYAEMLRELPFKVNIDSVAINNAAVIYEEDIPNNVRAGALSFEKINATVSNLSNVATNNDNLKIEVSSELMGAGKFNLNWEFNVQDPNNAFVISGGLSHLKTSNLNDFLTPNLRTKTTGTIDQLYFTISGDDYTANGDIKMKYEDFKFQVMDKERKGVKKLLSFIGNLFINDGSKADADGFRYGNMSTERVRNKSFFNYLWINLKDGLLDVLTGNGKKD